LEVILNFDVFSAWFSCIDLLHEVCPPLQLIQAKNCPLRQEETVGPPCKATNQFALDYLKCIIAYHNNRLAKRDF